MMRCSHPVLTLLCAAILLGLSACGSSPSVRFYTLTSLQEGKGPPSVRAAERRGTVAVGPVRVADYLDRPQIVRRAGATSVDLLEVDRWAGSLQNDIVRVLVDDLNVLLDPKGYLVLPWEAAAFPDGRVQVSVTRFEETERQEVVLHALWSLHGKAQGEILTVGNAVIVEPAGGTGTASMVEAMSRALAELSRRIADEAEKSLAPAG